MSAARFRPSRLLGIAVVGCAAAFARAETLQEAWLMAENHDARFAAAAADVEAARAATRAARSARLPQVSVGVERLRFSAPPVLVLATGSATLEAPMFATQETTLASGAVRLPLYAGGRILQGVRAADLSLTAASDERRAELATLRLDVAEAYVAVLRARRDVDSASIGVESLQSHVRDVQVQMERGQVPRSDLLATRVALTNAEQSRIRAANGLSLAYAAYNRRLGEPLDRQADLDARIEVDDALANAPVDALTAEAVERRSELAALEARSRALESQARAARAALLPQVTLSGSHRHLDTLVLDRKDYNVVSLGVTWSLFDGGAAWNRGSELRSASRAAELRLADLRGQVALEVRAAWLGVREARARTAAAGEAVAEATENLRASRELYGSGLATNTQVLDAVSLETAARGNRDAAGLDERLSVLRLARAIGRL